MDTGKATRKAKQKERILTILAISPRTVAMLAERMDIEKRWIRRLLDELSTDRKVYISGYERVNSSIAACYAIGDKDDAVRPTSVLSRFPTSASGENPNYLPLDSSKPVQCYEDIGIWGQRKDAPKNKGGRPKKANEEVFDPTKPVPCYRLWGLL